MNDFERKLSQQPFRTPPPSLRTAIFGALANLAEPARWTWRDWFWPSPQAWGALVALWLLFIGVQLADSWFSGARMSHAQTADADRAPSVFLTSHAGRDLRHVLELAH